MASYVLPDAEGRDDLQETVDGKPVEYAELKYQVWWQLDKVFTFLLRSLFVKEIYKHLGLKWRLRSYSK